jgi:hypothetical protein
VIPRIAAIILITLLISPFVKGHPWAAPPSKRHALLIGINDYSSKDLPDLRGAVNDVRLLKRLLMTTYGFSEQDITVVADSEATREGILRELEKLASRAGTDPHDGRTPGIPDITDDELQHVLARIQSQAVTIVLDSCHSGTATRGSPLVRPRFVPDDSRSDLYKDLIPAQTRAIVPLMGERHLLLTAAASHELALDAPIDGTHYGMFSYALAQSIQASGTAGTALSVFENIGRELQRIKGQLALYSMPEAQLEAPRERLNSALIPSPGIGEPDASVTAGTARIAWVEVQPSNGESGVILRESVPLGAVPGSVWAVYSPGEKDFPSGGAITTVTVKEQRGSDAFAKPDAPGITVEPLSRAVLLFGPVPSSRIPVRWLSGSLADRKKLEAAISGMSDEVHFVGETDFARFVLSVTGNRGEVFGADGLSPVADISAENKTGLASRLLVIFRRSLTVTELMSLNNPVAKIHLNVMVARRAPRQEQQLSNRGVKIVSGGGDAQQFRIRRDGEPRRADNSLQLKIEASTDCYLTLVDVDSEGTVTVVFPNVISEKAGYYTGGRIPGGTDVLIPDSLEPNNRAGYYVDLAPPPGMDTIRGFCSTDKETAEALRRSISAIPTRSGGAGSRSTRGLRGSLRHVLTDTLRQDFTRSAFRGVKIVPDGGEAADVSAEPSKPRKDWVATSLTIYVKE